MLNAMLEHSSYPNRNLSSLKALTLGGSTVPMALVKVIEEDWDANVTIIFGQTECSPVASMTRPDDSNEDKTMTLGRPMPKTEAKIVDPQSGETVACGVLGEFCTRGYHVMHCYFDMDDATANAIDDEGWLHTGDLCSMDERGYSKIEGRLKDVIIRGGGSTLANWKSCFLGILAWEKSRSSGCQTIIWGKELPRFCVQHQVRLWIVRRCSNSCENISLLKKPRPTGMNWISFHSPVLGRFRSLN